MSNAAEKRAHPENRTTAGSTCSNSQRKRPQRRPQLWKRKPVKEEREEGEGHEEEREESREKEYEDEDFGKCAVWFSYS